MTQTALDEPAEAPMIRVTSRGGYSALWLMYVTAVDLHEHCMNCLIGAPSNRLDRAAAEQTHRLDEFAVPPAYYLCAVTQPYTWNLNGHLAFRHAHGEYWHGPALVPRLLVTLHDAQPILGWGEHSIPREAPHAREYYYRTCRNWQFAWHAHRHLGLKDRANPAPRTRRTAPPGARRPTANGEQR